MTKDQIFEIARKWGMFAAGLPQIEGFALDVIAASACGSAEPVAWVYCDTLHAEHCHLSDQEAINDGWLPLVYARHAGFAREDIRELAVKCGFKYWRASDAHGVTSSIAEAESLLADLLGVEVEIGGGKAAIADTAGAKPVGVAGTMPGTDGFTMAAFKASDVPVGTNLYASPAIDAAGASSGDVRDTARYLWLKHFGGDYLHWQNLKRFENDAEFDAYVDAGIAKESGK